MKSLLIAIATLLLFSSPAWAGQVSISDWIFSTKAQKDIVTEVSFTSPFLPLITSTPRSKAEQVIPSLDAYPQKSPVLAGFLSLALPGVGQIYWGRGHIGHGIISIIGYVACQFLTAYYLGYEGGYSAGIVVGGMALVHIGVGIISGIITWWRVRQDVGFLQSPGPRVSIYYLPGNHSHEIGLSLSLKFV
jgi:hypothetical protein